MPLELAALVQIQGKRGDGMVPIDHLALLADKDGTVRVAIMRNADVRFMLNHGFLKTVRIDRAAFGIDVRSIRLIADDPHRRTKLAEDFRRDLIGGAVRTIDDDAQSLEVELPR